MSAVHFLLQRLNFPVGTQQAVYADAAHFSSLLGRLVCGVWGAMEDVSAEAEALFYVPGSHHRPIVSSATFGRRG